MPFTFPSLTNPYNPGGQGNQQGPGEGPPPAPPGAQYDPRQNAGWSPGTQMGSANPGNFNMPSFMSPSNWSLPSMFSSGGMMRTAGGMLGGMAGGLPGMFIGRYLGNQASDVLGGGQQPDTPWYQGPSAAQRVVDANQPPSGEYQPQQLQWGTPDDSGRYVMQDDGTLVDMQTGAEYVQGAGGDWQRKTSMGTYRGDGGFVTGVMGNIPQMNPVGGNQEQVDMATQRMREQRQ